LTRIHIMGGPGSGKTTLARQLAAHLAIPYFEIGIVGWENGHGALRPLAARLHDIHAIAIQPSWATDNSFVGWTDELLEAADMIVFRDPPWRVACWHIIIRHLRASQAGTNRHKGLCFIVFLARPNYTIQASMKQAGRASQNSVLCQPYNHKVIRCRKSSEVQSIIRQLTAQIPLSSTAN
jgi:hypothetical protein